MCESKIPVANATLLTAFSSISSVSAMTNLFKTLNLSHNPHPKTSMPDQQGLQFVSVRILPFAARVINPESYPL
jgi:hypothetical protein